MEVTPEESAWLDKLRRLITKASQRAGTRIAAIERLALQSSELARMEYDFLFDKARHLLAIGYNVGERRLDSSYYDLLASEARFSSFVAIAQGELPQESWFALGRLLTTVGGEPILLSWSGSMFEYLMPLLVMPTYENTLLDQTCKAAVERQIEYGKKRGVPWGISESGYNAIDIHLNYQYRAFGVPGLGLKRGLAEDLVIAPYASALALMVAPEEACLNLEQLTAAGFEGKFGFYEAIDYTPSRLPRGQSSAVVRSFMAHHQGMSLPLPGLSAPGPADAEAIRVGPFVPGDHVVAPGAHPQSHDVLCARRRDHRITTDFQRSGDTGASFQQPRYADTRSAVVVERQISCDDHQRRRRLQSLEGPRRHPLARRQYLRQLGHVLLPPRRGERGVLVNRISANAQTIRAILRRFSRKGEPSFAAANKTLTPIPRSRFRPRMTSSCAASPLPIALGRAREIDVTSYAEVVLAPPAADALHPAFSNLFVQTEIIRQRQAILCTRRPRSHDEQAPWMFHLMAVHGAEIGEVSYETDRMQFIGRGRTVADPQAMSGPAALSGSEGSVLDPIVAIRYRITLDPEESVTINIVSGIGETREACLGLVEKYQDRRLADRVFDLAWTHSQVVLRQINASEADAQLYCRLASSIIYANASLRADPSVLIKNRRGQSGLWGYAISGDLPIVLLQIEDPANIDLVRQLIQAHAYWRLKGLAVDLVIWNEDHAGYRQLLHDQIMGLIAAGIEASEIDRPGGIFVRPADQISEEDRILFQTVARAIITDSRGALEDQINRRGQVEVTVPPLTPTRTHRAEPPADGRLSRGDLTFFNGLGGFTPDGREYVITTADGQVTPAPWVNVLANPHFGTVISESGLAYTWSENAHEFRLTPWGNDPVSDSSGEAFYLRDEETRPLLVPHAAALPRRDALRHPPRIRLQRLRAHRATASAPSCGFTWPWTHRSSSRCSKCATCRADRAGSPLPGMWNGCWATCGRNRPCT